MVTTAVKYAPVAIKAARVLHHVARLYAESAPQEREAIKSHLQGILDALRRVATRSQEASDLPALLMLPPADILGSTPPPHSRRKKRLRESSRQFRNNMRQLTRTIRQYASSFTTEEAKEIADHLNEIRKILSEINRRTRN